MVKPKRFGGFVVVGAALALGMFGCGSGGSSPAKMDSGTADVTKDAVATDANSTDTTPVSMSDASPDRPAPTTVIVASAATVSVTEGAQTTFMVTLSRPSSTPISVTVASGDRSVATVQEDTLEFAANEVGPKIVTVSGSEDDDVVNNSTTITLSAVEATTASVRVQVTDDDQQALLVSPTQISMTEGGTSQVNIRLAFRPSAAVNVTISSDNTAKLAVSPATLALNASNYSVPQTVTLTAAEDGDTTDDMVNVSVSATGIPTGFTIPVRITDNDVLNLDVMPASLSLNEGATTPGSISVKLTQKPSANVTVTVASSNALKATATPATLTFTADNFSTAQTISVNPLSDDDFRDEAITVNLTSTGLTAKSVSVAIHDDDTQAIQVPTAPVSVAEMASVTVNVRLAFNPGGPAGVNVFSSNSSKVTVNPPTLFFDTTNFATAQTVTIQGVKDDDLANDMANLTFTSSGANSVVVPVTVTDIDTQAVQLIYAAFPGPLVMQETQVGGAPSTATVGVRLAYRPAAAVTLAVTTDSDKISPNKTTLTFSPTDYSTAQFITLTAPHDNDLLEDTVHVSLQATGIPKAELAVTIVDMDVQNFAVTPSTIAVAEPTAAAGPLAKSFTVALSILPPSAASITVTSDDPDRVSVGAGSFSLNDTAAMTVPISIKHDADAQNNVVTLTVHSTNTTITDRTVTVAIADTDSMHFDVALTPANLDPQDTTRLLVDESGTGKTATFSVKLSANPVTTATVAVTPSVSGLVTIAPATLMFTSANWQTPQTVTVTGLADTNLEDELLTIRIAGALSLGAPDAFVTARKRDVDMQGIVLSTTTTIPTTPPAGLDLGTLTENGLGGKVYVSLSKQPSQSVTVTVNIPAGLAGAFSASPTSLNFNTANYNTPQLVTISAVTDRNTDSESGAIAVTLAGQDSRDVSVVAGDSDKQTILVTATGCPDSDKITCNPVVSQSLTENRQRISVPSRTQSTTLNISLAFPPHGSPAEGETITLTSSASTKVTVSPSHLTFSSVTNAVGGWNIPQAITITSVADTDIDDESETITLSTSVTGGAWSATSGEVAVSVADKDIGMIVTPTAVQTIKEDGTGNAKTYKVHLTDQPPGNLTVSIANSDETKAIVSDPMASMGVATLVFSMTDWMDDQNFTVTGVVDDNTVEDQITLTLTSSAALISAATPVPLTVKITDTNTPAPPPVVQP